MWRGKGEVRKIASGMRASQNWKKQKIKENQPNDKRKSNNCESFHTL